jgi:tetratricopeptide (TPR) repeat protein
LDHLALRFFNEALSLAKDGANTEASISKLHASIAIDPKYAPSWVVLGKLHAQRGEYQDALQALRQALENGSEAATQGKATKAVARIEEILGLQRDKDEAARVATLKAEKSAVQRRRLTTAGLIAGISIATALATAVVVRLPPSPERAARAVRIALESSPAIRGRRLSVAPANGALALAGEVTGTEERELAETIARHASSGLKIDTAGLRVTDAHIAGEIRRLMATLPQTLRSHVPGVGMDILDAMDHAQIAVLGDSGDKVRLSGTVPMLEVKPLIRELVAGIAGSRPIDDSGVQVADAYIQYVIRAGDAPESIARTVCGSGRRLEAIRNFSPENAETLSRMQIGSVLRIPERLLAKRPKE